MAGAWAKWSVVVEVVKRWQQATPLGWLAALMRQGVCELQ